MKPLLTAISLAFLLATAPMMAAGEENVLTAPNGQKATLPVAADKAPQPAAPKAATNMRTLINASDYVMGKPSAPVVIVEYASLSCPHCAHFSTSVLPELEKKYIDTGKVRYVLRQFPLNEPALRGAMLVNCVGEHDSRRYYVFSRVLFDAQSKWAFDGNWQAGLQNIAKVGGVSAEQFSSCINNPEREAKLLQAKKEATDELKIPHTPYFYIDGEAYEGERTVEDMSKAIEARLAAKK